LPGFHEERLPATSLVSMMNEIARMWRGFICHSHYDGVILWNYPGSDRLSASKRLNRLQNRPQFISHEGSVADTRLYLAGAYPMGNFVFQTLRYRNHTDLWVLRDIPERRALRKWLADILGEVGTTEDQPIRSGDHSRHRINKSGADRMVAIGKYSTMPYLSVVILRRKFRRRLEGPSPVPLYPVPYWRCS